jgi:hypothetical protein
VPATPGFNLVLVYQPDKFSPEDYRAIAHEIRKAANDIDIYIVADSPGKERPSAEIGFRPLLTFSPSMIDYFRPPRGAVFSGKRITKSEQMQRLAKGRVRVPKWTFLEANRSYSDAEWGRFVIVKPNAWGAASHGRGIELVRTSSLAYRAPSLYPPDHPGRHGHMLVQKFIDTGIHSEDYRVVAIFGRALYALRRKSLVEIEDLDVTGRNSTSTGIVSNSRSGPRKVGYCYEEDVLAMAAATYRAIPEVAFQAIDVRREKSTDRLFCLEINPGGNTWNFSSTRAQALPTIDGIRREDQLGAWQIAAEALIEKTRLFAS